MDSNFQEFQSSELRGIFLRAILARGVELQREGAVRNLHYDPEADALEARVYDQGHFYEPQLQADEEGMLSWCNCIQLKDGQCPHMAAMVLEWIEIRNGAGENPAGEAPLYAREEDNLYQTMMPAAQQQGQPALSFTNEELVEDYKACLEGLTVQKLRELAATRGVPVAGNRREPILTALAAALVDPEVIRAAVDSLSSEARLALDLSAVLITIGKGEGRAGMERNIERVLKLRGSKRDARSCLEELAAAGLAAVSESWLQIPKSVQIHLPADAHLAGEGASVKYFRPAPAPDRLARLAVHLLLLAQANEIKSGPHQKSSSWGGWPEKTGDDRGFKEPVPMSQITPVYPQPTYLDKETLSRLEQELGQPRQMLDYVGRLLEMAGLWRVNQKRAVEIREGGFGRFLALQPAGQARLLYSAATGLNNWTELDLLLHRDDLRLARRAYSGVSYPAFLNQRVFLRQILLRYLALLPEGIWAPVEPLLRTIHALGLDYSYPYVDQNVWMELGGKRVDPNDFSRWSQSYGRFYTAILGGPAHWLGLVDLAEEGERLSALRLTPYGSFLFGQRRSFEAPETVPAASPIRFLPGMLVEIHPGHANPRVLNLVPLIGKLQPRTESAAASQGAPASQRAPAGKEYPSRKSELPRKGGWLRYLLTPQGAARAFSLGWTVKNILSTLEEAAQPGSGRATPGKDEALARQAHLPEEVRQRFHVWSENYARVHLYEEIALVELGDDFALNELLVNTRLNAYLLYVFNPRLVAVRPEGVQDLLASLEASGYTPKVASPEEEPGG
jgi:hypothetical protein